MNNRREQTDAEFIADLERFGVPFGLKFPRGYAVTPPEAWRRVFDTPADADGRPSRKGGIDPDISAAMRQSISE